MKPLFIIPARAGSKGILKKNIRLLGIKPLIKYSFDLARCFVGDERICVSTDSQEIAEFLSSCNYKVPFIRPLGLATDDTEMNKVLLHATEYYQQIGLEFDVVVLLQPTSPFRSVSAVKNALLIYESSLDMVVSVCEPVANPYYVMFIEGEDNLLYRLLEGNYQRRQDTPEVYQLNGAIYVINPQSLLEKGMKSFTKNKKIIMDRLSSIDIDTEEDWIFAEFLIEKKIIVPSKLLENGARINVSSFP